MLQKSSTKGHRRMDSPTKNHPRCVNLNAEKMQKHEAPRQQLSLKNQLHH
jgi:hypothetical protein